MLKRENTMIIHKKRRPVKKRYKDNKESIKRYNKNKQKIQHKILHIRKQDMRKILRCSGFVKM